MRDSSSNRGASGDQPVRPAIVETDSTTELTCGKADNLWPATDYG